MDFDRISGLPDNVIDNILKYLPLPNVVRTSVLSREWRYKWVTVPHLNFDWSFDQSLPSECPRECVISHILLFHKGSIVKFSLTHGLDRGHMVVDRWLLILKSKCVEELSLSLDALNKPTLYAIPNDLFSFHLLRDLLLTSADINLPSTFQGFSGLVKLSLRNVRITSENLRMFMSKCPKLESLSLSELTGITTFWCHDVDAPRMKYLSLAQIDVKLPRTFNGFSLLAELWLWTVQIAPQELQRFVSECPLLELVSVQLCFDQTPSCHLDINATNLKHLTLDHVDFTPTFEGFSRLIRLDLENVRITPEELRSVISKCPMFEWLSISSCFAPTTVWCLDIDAPNLKTLYLNQTDIKLPPTFRGFGRLDSLSLEELRIDPKELQLLVLKCPMLDLLIVDKCNDQNTFWSLNIDVPNLRSLDLEGLFSSISLKKSGSVKEVSVEYPYYGLLSEGTDNGTFRSSGSNIIEFFGQLPSLVKLEVGISFLQFLALGGVPQELPCKLNSLMKIELRNINFGILDNVSCAVCLIRSSPVLCILHITFEAWNSVWWGQVSDIMRAVQTYKTVEYLKGEQKQNIPYNNLKTVSIEWFSGVEPEVEFLKLLLLWGTELEQLELVSYRVSEELDMAIEELKMFHWQSSSKAKFIIDKQLV
ncbi:F-box/FBD/LRR-repeat protein At1g13570-like [Andrographis paniculata]|uniref:F-box/FBD/LRR-repeat protein At1g13570-like n=1 Tax=Andrographis paniculata TaxID=175694 RepID=UPI0021E75398|nr:F-box/FBD/LRR-repeat protein At1g13570-like [Andrographis paniculata]